MRFSKRSCLFLAMVASLALVIIAAGQTKAPAKAALKKVENTDPALRMKWVDQHLAMKAQTPFKDMKWRFIGPDIIGGRCVDIAVPKGSRNIFYIASAVGGLWKTENTGITWSIFATITCSSGFFPAARRLSLFFLGRTSVIRPVPSPELTKATLSPIATGSNSSMSTTLSTVGRRDDGSANG